jgi:hypothetical protein
MYCKENREKSALKENRVFKVSKVFADYRDFKECKENEVRLGFKEIEDLKDFKESEAH